MSTTDYVKLTRQVIRTLLTLLLLTGLLCAQSSFKLTGVIEQLPTSGLTGTWKIAGKLLAIRQSTEIDQEKAKAALGALAVVESEGTYQGLPLAKKVTILQAASSSPNTPSPTGYRIVAWNDLGMHCMDATFDVFAILPPFNDLKAQLINNQGKLVTSPNGITLTYQAVADPDGSINRTSVNKTNFWAQIVNLFGPSANLPADTGLIGNRMPGASNTPQPMPFQQGFHWFAADGIPITPYDDAGRKNYYPMMLVTARDSAGQLLAQSKVVLPVSDEMDCRLCHGSNTSTAARPSKGWINLAGDPDREYRYNILRLHDDRQPPASIAGLLASAKLNPAGLEATALSGKGVLCAACHSSNALPGSGLAGVPPFTQSMHGGHSSVTDPLNGLLLNQSSNRAACYRCHPGSETRCLRGVMGNSVAPDGSLAIQCQDCHGTMSAVGAPGRIGWLDQPSCQNCHTGTATSNSGQIRFTSAFDAAGNRRAAANLTFATKPNTPAPGFNLYRFSTGHGGLQCEGCHGSTHAEYASSHRNDNIQSIETQGHIGTISECSACHTTVPSTANGGPHGMHSVGSSWVSGHGSFVERSGSGACRSCHGGDLRGSVLSRSLADRSFSTDFGRKTFWRGFTIGCYACHNGPNSESASRNRAPLVTNASVSTTAGKSVTLPLQATDSDGNPLTLRVVSQPAHGTVGLSGFNATYFPEPNFTGSDSFTFAAWDGSIDSNLGSINVTVR
ncbi:MAG TPA: Ig-like domain-containing protein [Pirellulaceae bacterium]|nr:Ig-like domain-containing protein [Pirellulaceae bacterium]